MKRLSDWLAKPLVRLLHERFRLSPSHLTWASFWASAAAAAAIAAGRVPLGLGLMALYATFQAVRLMIPDDSTTRGTDDSL